MESLVMDPIFWKNKKVLITGHTGFKGSWLTLWLQQLGAQVTGFALAPATQPNLFTLANVDQNINSVIGDIRDFNAISQVITEFKPDIIFHMAAQPLVRASYENPIETYAVNVMGTVHLLEAVRKEKSVKAVLNITTDKCYQNNEWHWAYRENDRLGGYDPYSNSKACSELVTAAFRDSFFNVNIDSPNLMGLASVRAGNVIGGGDWAQDRLIPDLIRNCSENITPVIRSPHAIRPWQHVLCPLSGYIKLAEHLCEQPRLFAGAWNFGPDDNDVKSVTWIADFITKEWGNNNTWTIDKNPQPHEANYLKLDSSKVKAELNWQPRWNLVTGLRETIFWYKAYKKQQNMREVTLSQIHNYAQSV